MPTNVINGNQPNANIYDFSEEDEVLLNELEAVDDTAQGNIVTTEADEAVTTMTREYFNFTQFNSISDFSEAYAYAADYYDRNCNAVIDMINESIKENNFLRKRIFKNIKQHFIESNRTYIVDNKPSNIKINKIVKNQVVDFLNLDIKKFFLFEKMHFWIKNKNNNKTITPDFEFLESLKTNNFNNFIVIDFEFISLLKKEYSIINDKNEDGDNFKNLENIKIEKKYNITNTLNSTKNSDEHFYYDFVNNSQEEINVNKNKTMLSISNYFDMLFVDPKNMSKKEYKLKNDHFNTFTNNGSIKKISNNNDTRNVKLMNSVNYSFLYNSETSDTYKTKDLDCDFDHFSFFKETNEDLDIYIQGLKKEISERFEIPENFLEEFDFDNSTKKLSQIYKIVITQIISVLESVFSKFENYILANKNNVKNIKIKREYIKSKIATLETFIKKLNENREIYISDFNSYYSNSQFRKSIDENLFGLIYKLKDKSYFNVLDNSININSITVSSYQFKNNFKQDQPFCNFKYGKMINNKIEYDSNKTKVFFPCFSEFKINNKDYFDFKLHNFSYNQKKEKVKNTNFIINKYTNISHYFEDNSLCSEYDISDFINSKDYISDYIKFNLLSESYFKYNELFAFMENKILYSKYLKFENFKYIKQNYEKENKSDKSYDIIDEYNNKSKLALTLENLLIYFTTNQYLLFADAEYINSSFGIKDYKMIVFKDNKVISDLIFKNFISENSIFTRFDKNTILENVYMKYEKALKTISPVIFTDSIIERCSTNIKKYYPILDISNIIIEFGNTESDFEKAATAIYSKSNGNYSSPMVKSQANSCMRYLKCITDNNNSINRKLELSKGNTSVFFTNSMGKNYNESYYGNCKSSDYVSIIKQENHVKHPTAFYANGDFMSLAIKSKTLKDTNDNDIYYLRSVIGVYDTRKMYSIPDYYDLEKNIICHKEVSFLDFYKYHYERIIGGDANQDKIYNDILENDYVFVFGPFYISDFNTLHFVKDFINNLSKDTSENNKFKDKKIAIYGIYDETKLEIKEFPIGWTGLETNKLSNLVFKYNQNNEFFIFKPYVDLESNCKYNEKTDSFIFTKTYKKTNQDKNIISELINKYINIKNDKSLISSKIYNNVNQYPSDFYYDMMIKSKFNSLFNDNKFQMIQRFNSDHIIFSYFTHQYESLLFEPNGFSKENVLQFKINKLFNSRSNGTTGWYKVSGCEETVTIDLITNKIDWTVGVLEKDPCWFVNQNSEENPEGNTKDEEFKIEEAY